MRSVEELRQTVFDWCASSLGWRGHIDVERLGGGANNAVFRATHNGDRVIIKHFPATLDGRPDRFGTEHTFLTYANSAAPGYVPALRAIDKNARIMVMELVAGLPYTDTSSIAKDDVHRATQLLHKLNVQGSAQKPDHSLRAADGFLKLSEHFSSIQSRTADMTPDHLPIEFHDEARSALRELQTKLETTWHGVQKAIERGDVSEEWSEVHTILSPSDFGFHNAIKTPLGAVFFDFEFAGWDDPAKTIADFFLQPRLTVDRQYYETFLEGVLDKAPREAILARTAVLTPILRLKWVSIALAVLQPERWTALTQIAFDKSPEMLIRERLNTARALLLTDGA